MRMEKKTVLITTNHPAPYIDQWLKKIEEKYTLIALYNKKKDEQKTWKGYRGHSGYYYEDLNIISLIKLVQQSDLLIVGGWTNKECFTTILLGKLFRKKVSIFTDFPFHQNKYADLFKKIFLYRIIDYVFCATESTCDYISEKYKVNCEKVKLFPYAVNLPKSVPDRVIRNDELIRVFVANNFIERKGYRILFEALEKLKKTEKMNRFMLDIAGHGELFEKYKHMAEENLLPVKFYGWCEQEEYDSLKERCDVYIHASLEEPFGIPPLDAMASEKVVIVSDGVKSTDRLIENGVNGYIYPAEDSDRLCEILSNLNKIDFARIGEQARKDVISKYDLSANMKSIEECLLEKRTR